MTTKSVLLFLKVLAWVVFGLLCFQAGAVLVSGILWMVKPDAVEHLYKWAELEPLFQFDQGQFMVITVLVSIVVILKALLFYLIVRMMENKNLSFKQPFHQQVNRYIKKGALLALLIGIFSKRGMDQVHWLTTKAVPMPDAEELHLEGAAVWVLMALILFIITQVFKRGIELQQESELTV